MSTSPPLSGASLRRRFQSLFLPCLLAASAAGTAGLHAQSYLFDFGSANFQTTADPANTWNNIVAVGTAAPGTPAAQADHVVSTTNVASDISLVMLARFNGANEAGATSSTLYPSSAVRDSLFGNTETFGAGPNFFPSFKFTGLDPQVNHTLTFYASRSGVGDNRETLYTVTGANSGSSALNASNNVDGQAIIPDIKPSAAGEITITIGPGANNNNANHFTYLGVLRLDVNLDQTPIVFTTEPADTTVMAGRPVTFTAAVDSTPPYTIQWQKDGVAIEGANQFTYSIPAATTDLDGSKYSVTVSNLQFTGTSRTATLHVTVDNVPPTVTASSPGPQNVILVFSEDMEDVLTQDPASYVINDGAVTVINAVLQPDRRTVILTTQEEMSGSATVKVSQVQDANGNAIVANTPVTLTVPVPDGLSWLIDFGTGGTPTDRGTPPDDPLYLWNNVTESVAQQNGGELANLIKNDGTVTDAGLQIVSRFNAANTDGIQTSTLFPTDATRDTLYGNSEAFNNLTNITPVFRLTGLDGTKPYDLQIYASRNNVTDNRETRYTVTGLNSAQADLNVANNVNNSVSIPGIYPDAEGGITIALSPGPNNNNGNHFVYIGVLKFSVSTAPVAVVLTAEPQDTIVHDGDPVTFTVGVQSPQPYTIQWKKNGQAIAGADQLTYTIPAAGGELNGAKYSVTVTYLGTVVTSREASLRVTTDRLPPTVLLAMASPTNFTLVFSEDMDKASAEKVTNYTVNDGAVTLTSAALQFDGRTVILATPDTLEGEVTVKVSGVRDFNTNPIAAGTEVKATVPFADGLTLLLDFGGSGAPTALGAAPDDPLLTWNNVTEAVGTVDGGILEGLLKNDATSTTINLTVVSRFNAVNGDGTTASTLFPQDATRDSLYGNTEPFNNLSNVTPVIRFTGLDAAAAYGFTFYASRGGVTDNRETRYTVTGANSGQADLNIAANVNNTASVDGIRPDAEGGITIALTPGPNNNNGNHFIYLGVLKITPQAAPPAEVVMLPPVIQNGNLIISWTGTGTLETSTELESGWVAVNPAPSSPYSIPLPVNGRKFFRVRP